RAPGQIGFPAISGCDNHQKRSRAAQAERLIKLTLVAEEDIELMAEFGVVPMQKGRLFRLIEEAWAQDAILDARRLAVLLFREPPRAAGHAGRDVGQGHHLAGGRDAQSEPRENALLAGSSGH
ncbi:MAG: DUF1670 domain-containing protein, partial [Chloroflexi bacterium]|nr:DUF1670 domain-containing protein [Chloroflexota bacterium]